MLSKALKVLTAFLVRPVTTFPDLTAVCAVITFPDPTPVCPVTTFPDPTPVHFESIFPTIAASRAEQTAGFSSAKALRSRRSKSVERQGVSYTRNQYALSKGQIPPLISGLKLASLIVALRRQKT